MEDMVKYIINHRARKVPAGDGVLQLSSWIRRCLRAAASTCATADFGRVTYTEAVELLQKSGKEFDYPVAWGVDLQTEHERYLTEEIFKKPVFVTDYPKEIKAFYMRLNDDGKTVAAADCLVPGIGEIIGGSPARGAARRAGARAWTSWVSTRRITGGICDLRRYGSCQVTRASVWALSAWSCTSPACPTSATWSCIRVPSATPISNEKDKPLRHGYAVPPPLLGEAS